MSRPDRFDRLSRVRKKSLDQAMAALARIEQSQLEEGRKLDYLRTVREEYEQRSPVSVSSRFDIPGLQRAQLFNERLDQAIAEQTRRVESLASEAERRRQLARDSKRAVETLDKLVERQSRVRAEQQFTQEQKHSDEAAAIRSTNTRGDLP